MTPRETTLIALCVLGLAMVTADVVTGGLLTHVDGVVRARLQAAVELPGLLKVLVGLGGVGTSAAIVGVVAVTTGQLTWRWWPLAVAAANWSATGFVVLMLKLAVGRDGPGVVAEQIGYPGYFPSGHTALSAVAAGTCTLIAVTAFAGSASRAQVMRGSLAAAVVVGGLVGGCAVWEDQHWTSDALGGLLLAVTVVTISAGYCRRYVRPLAPADRSS